MDETTNGDGGGVAQAPAPAPAQKVRANSIISVESTHDGLMRITVRGFPPMEFNPAQASVLNRRRAEMHGWKARLSDAGAVSADTTTGKTDPGAKYEGIKILVEHYMAGGDDWNRKSAVGARGKKGALDVGMLVQAMIELEMARDVDHANRRIDAMAVKRGITREEAMAMLWAAADVVSMVATITARNRKNALNASDLLAEMDDEEEGEEDSAPF